MKVKVQCPCGARFEFEVEPVNERMPVPINCPVCNVDATALANAIIQQQSAPPSTGLRISKSTSAHPAPATTPPPDKPAPRHPGSFYPPASPRPKSVPARKSNALVRSLTYAAVLLVLASIGLWIWYVWFARNPKVVYSLPIPKISSNSNKPVEPDAYYQLIGPGQLLSIKNGRVNLFDVMQQRQLWSTPLQDGAKTATADTDYYYFSNPGVMVTSNDLWISFPNQLVHLDSQTGERKDSSIPDKILNVTTAENAILVTSAKPDGQRLLTEITLPDGNAQTEELSNSTPAKASPKTPTPKPPANKVVTPNAGAPDIVGLNPRSARVSALSATLTATKARAQVAPQNVAPPPAAADADFDDAMFMPDRPFIPAGPNVVELKTALLEKKTVTHQAMKAKGKRVLDNPNVTASQGLDLAQEMMNDSQRELTGGVETEDASRYQVTLHRRFAAGVSDWSGEVIGHPEFFAFKTVDILSAGQTLYAFDKNNKKLWDAKQTYSVASLRSGNHAPGLETKDALYFADLGILTRYDLVTGSVRWRLNSVGISRVQADDRGQLYVNTTTAGPESIKYSQQINIHEKIHPVILKVDAGTGKVLWRLESMGEECLLSGKFLYTTGVTQTMAALHLEDGPDTHYNLDLLDPANGHVIWNYHQGNRQILKTDVQQNWIMLHFDDGVVVLKFFSL